MIKQKPAREGPSRETIKHAEIDALFEGKHGDPFAVLGPHQIGRTLWEIRTLRPGAHEAAAIGTASNFESVALTAVDARGFFVGKLECRERPGYRLEFTIGAGEGVHKETLDDPYRFLPVLDEGQLVSVRRGGDALFRTLGAHPRVVEGVNGFLFSVWAPAARRVSVVGDFNDWDGRRHPMRLHHAFGVWEIFLPHVMAGARYKFEILGAQGQLLPLHADPLAFAAEGPGATASIAHGLPERPWHDAEWMAGRQGRDPRAQPISIYECHLGSWARVPEEGNRYLTYRELADQLIPYVKDLGFTHIELLPITEYPFDGSWGYQPVSLYAPTRRFGPPEDFQIFVEAAHAAGIGLLLDWVPGHFPSDAHGLANFDGTHLYEHADPRQGFHQEWGTHIYNYGREEVAAFLIGNARFWLEHYHLDGLRVDAVASMLYLDYSRKPGEWVPNRFGGNENLEAVAFLQRMNEAVYGNAPGIMTVAEESTAWPGVSRPTYLSGLGFGFKWNMGWMHDTLRFISKAPVHRRYHHHDLTFGLHYAFSENFILPLSHDEVVHGKGSLIGKMPGDAWQRFANLRAYLAFMWGHPGKKLLFMGGEFGQEREWNHDTSLDWHLLQTPAHSGVRDLVRDLNHLYRSRPALHVRDCEPGGFQWLVGDDAENSVVAWLRQDGQGGKPVILISNFTPVPRQRYRVGVPWGGFYREIINTDAACYGGSNWGNAGGVVAQETASHEQPYSIEIALPPLSTLMLEPD